MDIGRAGSSSDQSTGLLERVKRKFPPRCVSFVPRLEFSKLSSERCSGTLAGDLN